MEAVFRALQIGWSKEKIGSHIIRNNVIYDCGQNGIVGHMGCAFSEITTTTFTTLASNMNISAMKSAALSCTLPSM
jgi:alpha-L-arabinofuranosidase